jgi:hypothetical protein
MEYTTLGSTGIEVSRICLGTMSFGDPDWREWVRGEDYGHELVERAIDLGINFFDTANMYSRGVSERVLGDALQGHREKAVVATKGYFQMDDDDPNSGGLSRKALEQELTNSLDRSLSDPPLGLRHADRDDVGRARRRRQQRPSQTHRRVLDVGLSARRRPPHQRPTRGGALCDDAKPLQPRLSRGRT